MTSPSTNGGSARGAPAEPLRCPAHTKIVGTIGPASEGRIGELIDAGLSVARLNMSHGTASDHRRRLELIRTEARERSVAVGVLADIQGPKLRLGCFESGWADLEVGETWRLAEGDTVAGAGEILFNLEGLDDALEVGHRIYLADGAVELVVELDADGRKVGRVVRGGRIGDRKGVHFPDSDLHVELPTPKDRKDLELIAELGVDMIGASFVSGPEDVAAIRKLAPEPLIVAKIERAAAVANIVEILEAADGIMVARGDLGVEVELEQLPLVQKSLIQSALRAGKFTITATEMLESMVLSSRPSRAEVADVANAVLDGTDAIMLSAETAIGAHPVEAVRTMSRIAAAIEQSQRYHDLPKVAFRQSEPTFANATAMSAAEAAEALGLAKIICFTEKGNSVRLISRYRPSAEIIALTPHERTLQSMTVLAHVRPILMRRQASLEQMLTSASELLVDRGLVVRGEEVVFVAGVPPGHSRSTNVMKLHRIGEQVDLA